MDLARRPDESKFAYHKRLVYGKLVDKTLSDADYSELAELIYGRPYSSDVARRMLYGSRQTLELMDKQAVEMCCDDGIADELEAKRIELQKERQRLSDQRREYSKMVSSEARWEHLCDVIKTSVDDMMPLGLMLDVDAASDSNYKDGVCGNEAVLVLSDLHYGMVADNVYNKYNTQICKDRVSKTVRKAIERIVLHGCSKLHVVILGDCIHGAVHAGTRVMSEELTCDQLMNVSEILAQAICSLSNYVDELTVHTTYGNHARTIQNKSDSVHRDNMERIIPFWLKQRLKDSGNIIVADPSDDEFTTINVLGYWFVASHGDLDGVKGSPRLLATLFHKKYGIDLNYVLLGDKHHRESFEELGVTAMLCGSMCGADDYANEHRLYSDPSQLLLIVSKDNGVDAEYRLKV